MKQYDTILSNETKYGMTLSENWGLGTHCTEKLEFVGALHWPQRNTSTYTSTD